MICVAIAIGALRVLGGEPVVFLVINAFFECCEMALDTSNHIIDG